MRCFVFVVIIFALLLCAANLGLREGSIAPRVGTAHLRAQPSRTELMQQSHHKKRVDDAQKARTDDKQIAAAGIPEARTGDYDYVVVAILAASIVILAFVAGKKRHARFRV